MFATLSGHARKWACRFLEVTNAANRLTQSPQTYNLITGPNTSFCLTFLKRFVVMSKRNFKGHSAQSFGQTRLKVLLDLDQVLADFEGHFLLRYKERFPDLPFIEEKDRNTFYLRDQYAKLGSDLPVCEEFLKDFCP